MRKCRPLSDQRSRMQLFPHTSSSLFEEPWKQKWLFLQALHALRFAPAAIRWHALDTAHLFDLAGAQKLEDVFMYVCSIYMVVKTRICST